MNGCPARGKKQMMSQTSPSGRSVDVTAFVITQVVAAMREEAERPCRRRRQGRPELALVGACGALCELGKVRDGERHERNGRKDRECGEDGLATVREASEAAC